MSHLRPFVFLFFPLLFSAIHSLPSQHCPTPPPSPHLLLTHHLPPSSVPRAISYLRVPKILRLLFTSSITHLTVHSTTRYSIHARLSQASLHVFHTPSQTNLRFISHTGPLFPVPLTSLILSLSVKNSSLHLEINPLSNTTIAPPTQVFATAYLHDIRARVARVFGSVQCPGAIPHPTGWCNSPRNLAAVDSVQRATWDHKTSIGLQQSGLPNPRHVSEQLAVGGDEQPKGALNFLMVVFGQFVDHDIVLTPSGKMSRVDASFQGSRGRMPFLRSDGLSMVQCCEEGYGSNGQRRVFNAVSAFVDASVVYGSEVVRMEALRSHREGRLILKKEKGGTGAVRLPKNSRSELLYILDNANRRADERLLVAGDLRANENPIIMSLHTVFAKEHNRVCTILIRALKKKRMPAQTDEWLFQQARRVVMAELQSVVFNEFVPAMLGKTALPDYLGYDKKVDASIDLLFSTAAFRWGHSAIRNEIWARRKDGRQRTYRLEEAFFNPVLFASEPLDAWLRGAMNAPAMKVDLMHADSVRQFLFSPGIPGRLDLVALNIQRGRDHNLPSYLAARKQFGLKRGLGDIPDEAKDKILAVYGDPEKIDVFIGGLAEKKVPGSLLGPLFHAVVSDQFRRLRDGDRYYYQNVRWGKFMGELNIVKKIKAHKIRLANIIVANSALRKSDIPSKLGAMRTKRGSD